MATTLPPTVTLPPSGKVPPSVTVEDVPDDLGSLDCGSTGAVAPTSPSVPAGQNFVCLPNGQAAQLLGTMCAGTVCAGTMCAGTMCAGTVCAGLQLGQGAPSPEKDVSQELVTFNGPLAAPEREVLIGVRDGELNEKADTFVKLECFEDARSILRTDKFLFIMGPPGSGKTSMAHGLMRHYMKGKKNMNPIIVKNISELTNLLQHDNQILLFDDIFGKESLDKNACIEFPKHFPTLQNQLKTNKFIFTSRTDIHNQCSNTVKKHVMFQESCRIDLSELSPSDKKKLLIKHAEVAVRKKSLQQDHCLKGQTLERLADLRTPYGFPACVELFIRVHDLVKDPLDFFRRPLDFLKDHLSDLWENNRPAFGALMLAVQHRGRLDPSLLDEYSLSDSQELVRGLLRTVGIADSIPLFDIYEASDKIQGTYLKRVSPQKKKELELSHPAVYEAVLFVYGEKFPQHVPRLASLEFVINRISICTLKETSDCEKIILEEGDFQRLAQRFYLEILKQRFPMVATHCAFSCKQFIQVFQKVCEEEGEQGLLHALITRDKKYDMPLLYWSTWNKSGALFKWVVRELNQLKSLGSERDRKMADGLLRITPLKKAAIACCINGNKEALEYMFSNSTGFRQRMIRGLGNYPGSLPVPSFDDFVYELPVDEREESDDIPHRQSLLHIAALHNNPEIVSYLLEDCFADVNGGMRIQRDGTPQQDQDHQTPTDGMKKIGRTPLHVAARYGHADIVQILVEKRAPLLVPSDMVLKTPLHEACGAGHVEVVQTLVQALKEKDQLQEAQQKRDHLGHTPLHSAVYSKNPQVVKIILENEGDVEACDDKGNQPIHLACEVPGNDDVLQVLLDFKADPVARNKEMNVPMHIICSRALDEKMLKTLVETSTAMVHVFNRRRLTPLHMACERRAVHIIPFLLKHGANVTARDNRKRLPIDLTDDPEIKQILTDFLEESRAEDATEDASDELASLETLNISPA